MQLDSRIYVAGHRGLVGSALTRALQTSGFHNLLLRTRQELNLLNADAVHALFEEERPQYVFVAAAKVGGIHANNAYPADFIYENLQVQNNLLHAAWQHKVEKLLFLGSSCIYPKHCPQPIKEESLLTGPLEETNSPYAIAKIAGIEMCRSFQRQYGARFISAMPTNLYGIHDNFHPQNSHVLPALLRRFHEAKEAASPEVVVWGTGTPRREFLLADELAEACLFLMEAYEGSEPINVGRGEDVTIRELAETIQEVVGYQGELRFDTTKPDGTPRKVLDVSRLRDLGWEAKVSLKAGIEQVYQWYQTEYLAHETS
jgi:GDP-L-fucose synthase